MKGLLLRMLGAYAGLGVLSFALHRLRYLGTSQVRAWTDHRARRVEAELDDLRVQLADLRRQVRTGEAGGEETQQPEPLRMVPKNQTRRSTAEAPVHPEMGDRQRLAA